LLAQTIDAAALRRPGKARILSVACGHLREVELSRAVADGSIDRFFAIDQDEHSVNRVAVDYGSVGIQPITGSVRDILRGRIHLDDLDLVYAAGLYDYLPPKVAAALTRRMFSMLRSGGVLLAANFVPGIRDAGYLESFADWRLLYRDESDMRALAASVSTTTVAEQRLYHGPYENIVILEMTKA
jgi:SAM-dependent methyltransferase